MKNRDGEKLFHVYNPLDWSLYRGEKQTQRKLLEGRPARFKTKAGTPIYDEMVREQGDPFKK